MKVNDKLIVFEIKCLRSVTGVSQVNRIRNQAVRARTGVRRELVISVDFEMVWSS